MVGSLRHTDDRYDSIKSKRGSRRDDAIFLRWQREDSLFCDAKCRLNVAANLRRNVFPKFCYGTSIGVQLTHGKFPSYG